MIEKDFGYDPNRLNEGAKQALLIRHSERFGGTIAKSKDALTENGIAMAEDLGRKLSKNPPSVMFSSPIPRCIETAKIILRSTKNPLSIQTSSMLGKPGAFVINGKEIADRIDHHGLTNFAKMWFNGEVPTDLIRSTKDGSDLLLSWVVDVMRQSNDNFGLFVSHDLILTAVIQEYFQYDLDKEGLLNFLDGFVLQIEDDGYFIEYRSHKVWIPSPAHWQ